MTEIGYWISSSPLAMLFSHEAGGPALTRAAVLGPIVLVVDVINFVVPTPDVVSIADRAMKETHKVAPVQTALSFMSL